jgi:hypothetical protein
MAFDERETGMNLMYFNGSLEDSFDFVLTAFNMIVIHREKIIPDKDKFSIEIIT